MVAPHLLCFGFGYTATWLAGALPAEWKVSGTSRHRGKRVLENRHEVVLESFSGDGPLPSNVWEGVTHLLLSIPPDASGDFVLKHHKDTILSLKSLEWVGYLSTTGVYGDHQGGWVDETTPVNPPNDRSAYRVLAEKQWLGLGIPVHIFRLSGIYGPGRSAFDAINDGSARRIDKPGQVFSRIHVEDIVHVLRASMETPNPGNVYNVADDFPAPQGDVIAYACQLMGIEPPPLIPYETADLSEMARSFYQSNRRVKNKKIKTELGVRLKYPDYKAGLEGIYQLGHVIR